MILLKHTADGELQWATEEVRLLDEEIRLKESYWHMMQV